MRLFCAPFLAAILLASQATAQEHTPVPPGPEVEGLIDALAQNDREGAIRRVKGIFGLVDDHNDRFVRTPSAFVDLVLGCPSKQIKAKVGSVFKLYTYRWECPNGAYQAELGKDPDSSYVEVVDPADEARLERRANAGPMAPPMLPPQPRIESAEELRARIEQRGRDELAALNALEPQLKAGLLNATSIAERANFQTGCRDLAQSTFIAEIDSDGLTGANEQLDWLSENLGKPSSVECKQTRSELGTTGYVTYFSSCTVKTVRPGHAYTALINFRDAKVSSIQFNYMNRKIFELNKDYIMTRGRQN